MAHRFIEYRTGVECIGKTGGYYIFCDANSGTYGVTKDVGQETVTPPHCGYYVLSSLLKLKGLS
jgi:hypothetical protein